MGPEEYRNQEQQDSETAVGGSISCHQAAGAPLLIAQPVQPRHVCDRKVPG